MAKATATLLWTKAVNPKGGSSFYILLLWTDFAPQGSDLTWGGPLESLFGLAAKVNIRRTYIYASVCVHLMEMHDFPWKWNVRNRQRYHWLQKYHIELSYISHKKKP